MSIKEIQEQVNLRVPSNHTAFTTIVLSSLTVVTACIIGAYFGIMYLFAHFSWLIDIVLGVLILLVIGVPVMLLLLLYKKVVEPSFRDITQHGLAYPTLTGEIGTVAPLQPSTIKTVTTKGKLGGTKVEVVLPTFIECVKQGLIRQDTEEYFIGFCIAALKKYQQEALYTIGRTCSWLTGGKSGSGKTRFEAMIIFQMIFKGKIVLVCDPHYNKPDGLTSILKGLDQYLLFAGTGEEIVSVVTWYRNVLEYRKTLPAEIVSQLPDIVLVLEELRAIYHSDDINEYDKEVILETIERADVEYRGFRGFCYVTSQSYKNQDVGSTNFRSQISSKLLLTMQYKEAMYVVEDDMIAKKVSKLQKRTVLYVSDELEYDEQLHAQIPDISDKLGKRLGAFLKIRNFTTLEERLQQAKELEEGSKNLLEGPNDDTLINNERRHTIGDLAPSYISANKQQQDMNKLTKRLQEDDTLTNDIENEEDESTLTSVNISDNEQTIASKYVTEEYKDERGNKVYYRVRTLEDERLVENEKYKFTITDEQVQEVVNAYAQLKIQKVETSRRNIMEYLNKLDKNKWNNGKWYIFAYICYFKGI